MHTDEYTITMSRELVVCRDTIKSIRKFLVGMEARHGIETGLFLDEFRKGSYEGRGEEFREWADRYEALLRWEQRLKEYEEMFRLMKF